MSWPKRCVDLTEDHIDEALASVEKMRALLEHLASIARPNAGAAKILVPISRIATTACEWLDGKLYVEVEEMLGATEIAVSSDLGGGMRERIFPRLQLAVNQEELVAAVKLAPRLIWPLKYRVRGDRMILRSDEDGTVAPPAFEIAEESLRRSLPPKLRRSLPPIQHVEAGAILEMHFPKAQRALVIDGLDKLDAPAPRKPPPLPAGARKPPPILMKKKQKP